MIVPVSRLAKAIRAAHAELLKETGPGVIEAREAFLLMIECELALERLAKALTESARP